MAVQVKKGLIGEEDLSIGAGTFSRDTSTGGSQTITDINISSFATALTTFAANDVTPSVEDNTVFKTANTGAVVITNLDDGTAGQMVWIIFNDSVTTVDFTTGTYLRGNGGADWTPAQYDHMVCVYDGTRWYCQVSDNTTYNQILDED